MPDVSEDPSIHGNQCCPIQSRPHSVLGVPSSYVERSYFCFAAVNHTIITIVTMSRLQKYRNRQSGSKSTNHGTRTQPFDLQCS